MTKHLKLQIIQNMMNIKIKSLHSFINYLIKDLAKREKDEIKPNQQLAYETGKTIFRKFQKRQYIHFLWIIFGEIM